MIVRRGVWLNVATIAYNSLEALIALTAGAIASSTALIGFGLDSILEVTSALAIT